MADSPLEYDHNDNADNDDDNDNGEYDDDDPFACFGESDSDSSNSSNGSNSHGRRLGVGKDAIVAGGGVVSFNNNNNNNRRTTNATNAELGSRLRNEAELRALHARLEHLPIDGGGSSSNPPRFEVFDDTSKGRGMGLRALKSFSEGQEIMREAAVLRVPGKHKAETLEEAERMFAVSVKTEFEKLSPSTAAALMDLSSCDKYLEHPKDGDGDDDGNNTSTSTTSTTTTTTTTTTKTKTALGIYQTNSFQLGDEVDGGLFLTVSRINHSCRPNANHIWRPDLQMTLVLAARPIEAGEEICTSYGPSECLDTEGRRSYLRDRYSFECDCTMCREGNESGGDDRMVELNALFEDISLALASGDSESALSVVERGLWLLDQQKLAIGAYRKALLHNGYQISMNIGGVGVEDRKAAAHRYLEKELLAVTNSEGIGCYRAIGIEREISRMTMDLARTASERGNE